MTPEQTLREKIEALVWVIKFDKNKPNLPYTYEQKEVDEVVDQLLSLTQEYAREREKEVVGKIIKTIKEKKGENEVMGQFNYVASILARQIEAKSASINSF